MARYGGHTISTSGSYDGLAGALSNSYGPSLDAMISAAEGKANELVAYAAAFPAVSCNVPDIDFGAIKQGISDAVDAMVAEAKAIVDAVNDYSDGVWDNPANQQKIDSYLAGIPTSPPRSPGSDGDGGGGGAPTTEPTTNPPIDESLTIESPDIPTAGVTPEDINLNVTDEEIVIAQGSGSESVISAVAPSFGVSEGLTSTDTVLESITSDISSSAATSLGDFAGFGKSSIFSGSGNFSVPTPGVVGEISAVNSSSAVGAVGIAAAAAAAAVGGKFLYDKNSAGSLSDGMLGATTSDDDEEDDDDEDNDIEEAIEMSSETGSDVNIAVDTKISALDLKRQLLEDGEVSE